MENFMIDKSIFTPPNSQESEMMVLGSMLTNSHSMSIASNLLTINDFYHTQHQHIFSTLNDAHKNDKPSDVHLVCEELKQQGKLQSVGGAAYVTSLAQFAGTSAFIEEYIDILKKHANKRRLLALSLDLQKRSLSDEEPEKIVISIQEDLKFIEKNKGTKDRFPIKFLNELDKDYLLAEPPKKQMLLEYMDETGKPIGFLPKGIVSMLVGAGGLGKSHLIAQLASAVASGTPWLNIFTPTEHCGNKKKGAVFLGLGENSYEDIRRLLYKASKKLREHQPDIAKEDPIAEAMKRIAPFSFCGQQAAFIEDKKPSVYFRELKMRLIEMAPKDGWALILLDPVSRLMGSDAETDNAAATQFIALLEELTIDLPGNPTVLFAHHTNKASISIGANSNQTAARGSSALTDGVRLQLNYAKESSADKPSDIAILTVTKSNFTKITEGIKTQKDIDGFIENASLTGKNLSNRVRF